MRNLVLWQTYSREEVHGIFSPATTFTPQAGTWGLQGIVRIPERPGSFIFFVTFGQSQGDFDFDESITDDGVLTWQSQPKQRLQGATIQELIDHDDRTDSIHLFLRTRTNVDYTYCGTLGYLVHDEEREQPVRFQWQLLDWPVPAVTVADMGLPLVPTNALAESFNGLYKTELIHRRGPWRNVEHVEWATLNYVDWFNNRRIHNEIGKVPPAELEQCYYRQNAA
jgi:hypothetical protein